MRHRIHITIAFMGITLLTSCRPKTSDNEKAASDNLKLTQAQFESNQYKLGKMTTKRFHQSITTTGMIDVPPQNKVTVAATIGGFVKRTHLLIGDKVEKGQKMLTLENNEFVKLQKEYLEIHHQLAYLKAEYNRHKTLFEENITSEKNFLQAKSQFEMAKASHAALKKQLQLLNISPKLVESGNISTESSLFAPISGHITKVSINKGSFVSPSSVLFEIIDNSHLHLELTVFEKDALKVKKGHKIAFKIPETGDEIYLGEVHLVGASVDNATRTVEVHGHLNEGGKFLTGMFVEAQIITDSKAFLALPDEAIVEKNGRHYALMLQLKANGSFQFIEVGIEPGLTENGHTQIKNHSDFKDGQEFLIKGTFDLIAN